MLVTQRMQEKGLQSRSIDEIPGKHATVPESKEASGEKEMTLAEQLEHYKLRCKQLEFEVKNLRKRMRREGGQHESQMTLVVAEHLAEKNQYRYDLDLANVEVKRLKQVESEKCILEQEVEILRDKLYQAHDEITELSVETAADIAALKRHNYSIGLKMSEVMKDTLSQLESMYEQKAIDKVDLASRVALQCRGEIQKELDHSQSVVESMVDSFKAQEEKLKRTQLLLAMKKDEKAAEDENRNRLKQRVREENQKATYFSTQLENLRKEFENEKKILQVKVNETEAKNRRLLSSQHLRTTSGAKLTRREYNGSMVTVTAEGRCSSCLQYLKLIPTGRTEKPISLKETNVEQRGWLKDCKSSPNLGKIGSLGLKDWEMRNTMTAPEEARDKHRPVWLSNNQTDLETLSGELEEGSISKELLDIESSLDECLRAM